MIFGIFLTEECNWACRYCDLPGIEKPRSTNVRKLKRWMEEVTAGVGIVQLSGGEIGKLDEETIDELFKHVAAPGKPKVQVATNGLFIRKYPELTERVRKNGGILLHTTPEIDIVPGNIPKGPGIERTAVAHPSNISGMNEYARKIDGLDSVIPYNMKTKCSIPCWSKENAIEALTHGCTHMNDFLTRVAICEDPNERRIKCATSGKKVQVDLVNERILRCCNSYTMSDSEPLLSMNVRKLKNGELFRDEDVIRKCGLPAMCRKCWSWI